MDAATRDRNIATWLGDAPQPVRDTTNQLLERIALLRAEQTIYPAQDDILNALAYTPADQVKVVILGQDPYHGPNQAMGLSFSVPATQTKLPPSLRNIYKELKADLGCPIPATGDLTPWARQGVLLLNTTLTVREHAANSHAKLGWSTLTDYVIERCCQLPQPVVFLAWGRFAQQMVEGKRDATGAGKATDNSAWPPRTPRRFRPTVPQQNSPLLWGRAPSPLPIGYSNSTARPPSTGLASAKNRYIKNAPDGFPSGAVPIRANSIVCGRPRRHRSTDSVRS
ncbi:MAG: uracil-DNA glycosylase [Collinsella sp.]